MKAEAAGGKKLSADEQKALDLQNQGMIYRPALRPRASLTVYSSSGSVQEAWDSSPKPRLG